MARLLVLAFSLIGLASLYVITRLMLSSYIALIPILFIVLLPHFQGLARLVLIGLPAIALGLAALASATAFHLQRRRAWLPGARA